MYFPIIVRAWSCFMFFYAPEGSMLPLLIGCTRGCLHVYLFPLIQLTLLISATCPRYTLSYYILKKSKQRNTLSISFRDEKTLFTFGSKEPTTKPKFQLKIIQKIQTMVKLSNCGDLNFRWPLKHFVWIADWFKKHYKDISTKQSSNF